MLTGGEKASAATGFPKVNTYHIMAMICTASQLWTNQWWKMKWTADEGVSIGPRSHSRYGLSQTVAVNRMQCGKEIRVLQLETTQGSTGSMHTSHIVYPLPMGELEGQRKIKETGQELGVPNPKWSRTSENHSDLGCFAKTDHICQ